MSVILECPVCEARFQIEKIPARIDCPACKTIFKTPLAERGTAAAVAVPPSTPSSLAQAPRRLQSAPAAYTPQFGSSQSPPDQGKTSAETPPVAKSPATEIAIASGKHASSPYPMRQKKNIWVTVTSLCLAIAAIGGLFAIISVLGQPGDASDQSGAKAEIPLADETAAENPLDKALAKKTKTGKPELPPVDETPKFFTTRQWEVAWNKVNGYMVKLEVRTPIRTRSITGLIVDSRGWVVTSLSGLEDAGEVSVTMAGKNLTDDPPFRELSDLSRGIIATDPAHDLALISINRAQVINLTDIKLRELDNIVEASRFLIARTPPPRHRQWLAECRIAERGKFDELPGDAKKAIENQSLDPDRQLRWFYYPPRLATDLSQELAGSPLIDENGTVVAINTGVTTSGGSLAVPANRVQALIDSVAAGSPETRPFPRAADLIRQVTGDVTGDVEPPEVIDQGKSFEETINNLLKTVDECRKTDWSAELETEYASMQALSQHLDEAYDWVARNLSRVDNPEKYDELLKTAVEEITLSLEDDLVRDEFFTGKGNEFFFSQVNQSNPWFIISVEVVSDQFNSPQIGKQETIVFEVLGTGKHVIAAASREAKSFRKGRKFLLIGKLDAMGDFKSNLFDGEPRINLVNVHTHIEISMRGGGQRRPFPAGMGKGKQGPGKRGK